MVIYKLLIIITFFWILSIIIRKDLFSPESMLCLSYIFAIICAIYNIDNIHVVDEAEESNAPSNINHTKDVLIFAFIGIVASVIYVFVDNMLDTTVKNAEDIEKTCGVALIASIPFDNFENRKGGRK